MTSLLLHLYLLLGSGPVHIVGSLNQGERCTSCVYKYRIVGIFQKVIFGKVCSNVLAKSLIFGRLRPSGYSYLPSH